MFNKVKKKNVPQQLKKEVWSRGQRSHLSGDNENALQIPDVDTKAPLYLVLISNIYILVYYPENVSKI